MSPPATHPVLRGISDDKQHLCFAIAFWNGKDAIIKNVPGQVQHRDIRRQPNWRMPVWMPVNALIVRGLPNLYAFYGD